MSRACKPMCDSPMSPSISALGTSAATESITTMSTAPERTRISQISSACSPVPGGQVLVHSRAADTGANDSVAPLSPQPENDGEMVGKPQAFQGRQGRKASANGPLAT